MSENDDNSKADGSSEGGQDSPPIESSGTGLSTLRRLIKIVTPKPKPELGSSATATASLDKVSVSTSNEPLPAVSVPPVPAVEQTRELDGSPMLPSTQSQCDPSYLEQSDSTFLAHVQGPSPMVVVPDSPYIKKRRSRSAKAVESSKPEPEWHGMDLDEPSLQTSQHSVLEDIPSPDELRELTNTSVTTGKHKTVEEPPPPPVQIKVGRMTQQRSFSERAKIFFVELAVTIKKLFTPQL